MGLFERIGDLLSANVNDLIDKAENPLQMTRHLIRKIDEDIISLRSKVQAALGKTARLRKNMDSKEENIKLWEGRAEKAVNDNEDNLAKQALSRKHDLEKEKSDIESKWWEASQEEKSLLDQLNTLEDKAQEARRKKESIILKIRQNESSSDFLPIADNSEKLDQEFANKEIEDELENLKNKKNKG